MTAPSAPTREIGYAQTPIMSTSGTTSNQWWMVEDEPTPELRWPQSLTVYDQMRKQDGQVKSVLQAVAWPVRRTPWRIDPAGARDEVVQLVAEDLGLPIVGKDPEPMPRTKDRFSWPDHLREALLMLPFGHMYFEQVYRIVNGQARLRKLGARMPKTIEQIEVARDGGLMWIRQYGIGGGASEVPIPVSRLVAYINEKEGGNWLGQSLLRAPYKNWLLKDRLLRVQAQTIERNGMGIPVYEASPTEPNTDNGLKLATQLRAGEAAGASLPHEAKLRLMGVEGQLPDAEPAIRYHDEQIARGVLAHFLNLGTQTGSWALGTTFADFFTLSLQIIAQQIADVATQHIVEDLVDLNFGEDEPAPRIVFDEIGSRQAATAEAIRSLVDAGIITPDEQLERAMRQQYGLPPKDPNADPVAPQESEEFDESEVFASAGPVSEELDDDPIGELDDETLILLQAMFELDVESGLVEAAGFNPELHKRWPRGHPKAGKFRPMVDLLKLAIAKHSGPGHPFQNFKREQLRRAAKTRGITLRRNESLESIADKLLADLSGQSKKPVVPAKKASRPSDRVKTWEEMGSPTGPPPVGQLVGYEGGTYERLPGEPRRYRVVNSDGRDISDEVQGGQRIGRTGRPEPANQTADDARAALRVDAFNRQRVADDKSSAWRETLGQITASWSYDTGEIEGFDDATPEQRVQIRDALARWTGDKVASDTEDPDATRLAEPRVNAAIRGATERTEQVEEDIEALDLAMTMSKTKRRIRVARGVSNGMHILPDDWQDRDLTGLEWHVPGYTPTTGDRDAAEAYAGGPDERGFIYEMDLPRGTSAIAITDEIGGDDNEGEIVLPRNLTFRITRDLGPQGPHGIRTFEVKAVRRRTPAKKAAKKAAPPAAPTNTTGTRTVLGTDFTPAMQQALADIEDSGGMQKQRADFQAEADLSDAEMDRLIDGGFIVVDDEAGGGGFIGVTHRGDLALAELAAGRTAEPVKKATKKAAKKATPAKKAAKKVAPRTADPGTSSIPGVTVRRVPQVFGVAPDAYEIELNGTVVGHIHGNEADPDYGWVPFRPAYGTWDLLDPGDKPTKEAAIRELVDSYNARPGATPSPAPSPAPSAAPAGRRRQAAPAASPGGVPSFESINNLSFREFADLANRHGVDLLQTRREIIDQIRESMTREAGGGIAPRSAATPQPPAAPPAPISPQDKLIGNLIPTSYRDSVDRDPEIKRIIEEQLNGEYAGLTVRVLNTDTTTDEIGFSAEILDASGRPVGTTERILHRGRDGKLWVYHAYLSLNRDVQGQGFAEAWNNHLMGWYQESGVDRIEVTANIDVGGYTWARQGFDWKTKFEAENIAARLRRQLADNAGSYDADQVAAAEDVLDRIRRLPFGDPDFPSAYEVSQVGRKPGHVGRDDGWPGKDAMLGSYWSGVKPVPASGARPVSSNA